MTTSDPAPVLKRVLKRTLSSQLGRLAAQFKDRPVRLGELADVLQLRGYNAFRRSSASSSRCSA